MKFSSLTEALGAAPADHPFITAWIDEDERETVTFGEFRRLARHHAQILTECGAEAGDRVVILMPQSISAMAAFVGAMMLGAVPAFLAYPNFKVEPAKYASGLAGVTANLAAKAVIIDDEFPQEILANISLGHETILVRSGKSTVPIAETGLRMLQPGPNSLAFIQHSAGTTGLQKGVALTHKAVITQLDHLAGALGLDATSDRIYSWLPHYHDMGLVACFMLPMFCHLPVVMQPPTDWVMHPETMLQIITEYKCTLAWMPNFAFQFVPRRAPKRRWTQYDLSSLRALINCSEPIRASSMDEFQQAFSAIGLKPNALQSSYAMAENVFAVTQSDTSQSGGPGRIWADDRRLRSEHRIEPMPEGTQGSICFVSSGRLLPHHEVKIISDKGEPQEDGCVGEIIIRSDSLFDGYFNRPDLSSAALIKGWYHTGDLGFFWRNELYVAGRKRDLLIIGGENIYPQDIEEISATHPAVHDGRVIAIGLYNPELGTEDIVVIAEVQRDELLSAAPQIEQELRSLIVSGMGIAVKTILLKPPKWIVKSTAGKPARSATLEKLLKEHPEFGSKI